MYKGINIYKKTLVFTIILLFIGSSIIPSATSLIIKKNNQDEITEIFDPFKKSNSLKIKDIKGGIGITFWLSNEGDNSICDIKINLEAFGRIIEIKSPNQIEIPELKAGQNTRLRIRVSGLAIGKPIDYTRVKFTVSAPTIKTKERTILLDIVGPFVKIVSVFINDEDSFEGYTLFSPEYTFKTYLLNNSGDVVNSWRSDYIQGTDCYLLENGNLLRSCLPRINRNFPLAGMTGRVEILDWNGKLIWEFELSNNQRCLHHGFNVLPNGNILMIVWEVKTYEEAIVAGRNPLTLPAGGILPCYIIEVMPQYPRGGNIVWEWHVWDHLIQDYDPTKNNYGVVGDHPELIDINYGLITGFMDWNHINSIDYNEEFDQILISSHVQNEIWVIDHSTTIQEAAGHSGGRYGKGGDLLYRWGNPQVYRAGTADDQQLFGQHDARWIESGYSGEGHITVFNNGLLRLESPYSSVDEINPPVDENGNYWLQPGYAYGPKEPIWSYTAENPSDFYAPIISGAQRLPNRNTLICDGTSGVFFEVTFEKEIVWKYENLFPDSINTDVVKINRYPLDYPGIGNITNNALNTDFKAPRVLNILDFLKNFKNNLFRHFIENIVTEIKKYKD